MKVLLPFFTWLVILTGCAERADNYQLLEGEWRNVSMTLVQHSVDSDRPDSVLVIKDGDWNNALQMAPIRTTYNGNGTYVSRYYNLSDSLVFESEGTWHFLGDSLYMQADESTTAYHLQWLDNDQARFVARLDWDGEGYPDDEYEGVQQKQKK
jgi:hypothetical protein